jgi:PIN domain nuclease of toxin-antitoxin system
MTELAVTDAHALIWYGLKRWQRLGRAAQALFRAAEAGRAAIYVPTIALAEILEASQRGHIRLAGGSSRWVDALFKASGFFPADLTVEIVLRAEEFYALPDRADRLIAATAAQLDWPLVTRDPEIRRLAAIDIIW